MATREGTMHGFPVKWIVIGLAVIAAVAALFFWLGQKDTIKLPSADRAITEKIEAGTLTSDDLEAAAKEGIAEYNKLTGGESESVKPAVSEVGLPPIKEKWTIGELTLIYRETKSAKAMLRVWIDGSQIYGQNLLDKPIDLTGFIKYNGIIESESMGALTAKQKESIGSFEGITGTIELWYEIKTP